MTPPFVLCSTGMAGFLAGLPMLPALDYGVSTRAHMMRADLLNLQRADGSGTLSRVERLYF